MNETRDVILGIEARARAGLPEPGEHFCAWCGGPATVYADLVDGRREIQTARFVCPCCSFRGCPHRASARSCPSCGRPVGPGWATQCPFAGEHPAVST